MKTKATSLAIIFVFAAFTMFAQQPERRHQVDKAKVHKLRQMHAENRGENNFFTEEQKEAMKAIRLKSAKEVKAYRDELRELEAHHQTLTTADIADLNAINSSIEKIGKVKMELAKIRAKDHQEVRSLLTEEQRMKFDSRRNKMDNNRERHSPGEEKMNMRKDRKTFERG